MRLLHLIKHGQPVIERGVASHDSAASFRASVRGVLMRPAERVFGDETGDQAHARFQVAVAAVLERHAGDVAIVGHGTVISLLLARANQCDPTALWDGLSDLSILTVSWPTLRWAGATRPDASDAGSESELDNLGRVRE